MNLPVFEIMPTETRPVFNMKEFKIFGFGDQRTRLLKTHLRQALEKRPFKWRITEVTDVRTILDSEVHAIPALELDGRIVLEGTESSIEELRELLDALQ